MKTFVLDTSVLLYDPYSIFKFGKNSVEVPLIVIEELDRFKRNPNENGQNARMFSRHVDDLRKKGPISEGVELENGGSFRISVKKNTQLQGGRDSGLALLDLNMNDNIILGSALDAKARGSDVILISKDVNLRVKADVLGIKGDDYRTKNISIDDLYTGIKTHEVSSKHLQDFEAQRFLSFSDEECEGFSANQYCILTEKNNGNYRVLGRFVAKKQGIVPLIRPREGVWGVHPKNLEQQFALDALLAEEIKLVSLTGKAGTGKTLLAIASGLEQVLNKEQFSRMLVSRPVIPMGRDLGFLPGDIKEKLSPWMQPVFDNLDFLFNRKPQGRNARPSSSSWSDLISRGILYLEPLTYIRGRSIPNQYLVVDEAQNLSPHEIKTIITRAGEGTKIVLTGDCEQVDSPYLDSVNNGLNYCVERFRGESISAHSLLKVGERSPLSEVASKLL